VTRSASLEMDFDDLTWAKPGLVRSLVERVEQFCRSASLPELGVVFHSTGVNYAHQLYLLSILGQERLSRFRSVDFVSGSVIAAIVFYSFKTGHLRYGPGDATTWERTFFEAHDLTPLRGAARIPYRLARGRALLCGRVQMDVIRSGIGKEFADFPVSFFPDNHRFWLYDSASDELVHATATNPLSFLTLVELAVAATAVPRLFHPLEIGGFRFVDPGFSPARKRLGAALRDSDGPVLISNMVVDRPDARAHYLRPHAARRGRLLMLRELAQFCLGLSNRNHIEGLEGGLGELGLRGD